jgi:hypothetical protein
MATKTYRRGDCVKYTGSIQRLRGTWWTVTDVTTDGRKTISYTLRNPAIGRLHHVRAQSVTDSRDEA